ncbi:MAG: BatD family protein [archaeon]|jgi:hypothetical protein
MKGIKFAVLLMILLTFIGFVNSASLSLSLNSLGAVSEGETTTITATVTAVGDSVSNVSLQLGALPTGTSTSDSLTQSVGTLSSGQSSSKSWTVRGDIAGNYTFNITASGTSVSDVFQNASLVVNTAAYVDVTNKTCSDSTLIVGETVTMNFITKNTGGSSATVSINMSGYSSNFTLSSGSASSSFDLTAGSQSSKSYVFTATTAGTATINAAITSTKNDPTDQTCLVTITASTASTDTGSTTTTNICSSNSTCNDNNPCTTDSCVNTTCVHADVTNGTSCGTEKTCQSGVCTTIIPTTQTQNPVGTNNINTTDTNTLTEQTTKGTDKNTLNSGVNQPSAQSPIDLGFIAGIIVVLAIIGGAAYFIFVRKPGL